MRAGFGRSKVTAPDGSIFTAEKPSPTGWYYEGVAQASDLVWKALAPLVPERFSAGSYLSLCATYFSGAAAERALCSYRAAKRRLGRDQQARRRQRHDRRHRRRHLQLFDRAVGGEISASDPPL